VALNLIIGQGEMLLTPLQMAEFAAIVGARGNRPTPHLLRARQSRSEDAGFEPVAPRVERLPLDPLSLDVVRRGMRRAVESGTAKTVLFPKVDIAAKTGTAENSGVDHAAFIAFAPLDGAEIAIAVYLENRGHGGAVAAPVARDVLARYFGVVDSLQIVTLKETD
jgi:penicillin-binding protein 2